ncbi:hypothetical protein P154DRAFT_427836, partial [Amniculicola lignicola CBS 123094]
LYVQKLTRLEEGLKILLNISRREGVENNSNAKALIIKLDGLPLALSIARAYLKYITTSFIEYLQLYKVS